MNEAIIESSQTGNNNVAQFFCNLLSELNRRVEKESKSIPEIYKIDQVLKEKLIRFFDGHIQKMLYLKYTDFTAVSILFQRYSSLSRNCLEKTVQMLTSVTKASQAPFDLVYGILYRISKEMLTFRENSPAFLIETLFFLSFGIEQLSPSNKKVSSAILDFVSKVYSFVPVLSIEKIEEMSGLTNLEVIEEMNKGHQDSVNFIEGFCQFSESLITKILEICEDWSTESAHSISSKSVVHLVPLNGFLNIVFQFPEEFVNNFIDQTLYHIEKCTINSGTPTLLIQLLQAISMRSPCYLITKMVPFVLAKLFSVQESISSLSFGVIEKCFKLEVSNLLTIKFFGSCLIASISYSGNDISKVLDDLLAMSISLLNDERQEIQNLGTEIFRISISNLCSVFVRDFNCVSNNERNDKNYGLKFLTKLTKSNIADFEVQYNVPTAENIILAEKIISTIIKTATENLNGKLNSDHANLNFDENSISQFFYSKNSENDSVTFKTEVTKFFETNLQILFQTISIANIFLIVNPSSAIKVEEIQEKVLNLANKIIQSNFIRHDKISKFVLKMLENLLGLNDIKSRTNLISQAIKIEKKNFKSFKKLSSRQTNLMKVQNYLLENFHSAIVKFHKNSPHQNQILITIFHFFFHSDTNIKKETLTSLKDIFKLTAISIDKIEECLLQGLSFIKSKMEKLSTEKSPSNIQICDARNLQETFGNLNMIMSGMGLFFHSMKAFPDTLSIFRFFECFGNTEVKNKSFKSFIMEFTPNLQGIVPNNLKNNYEFGNLVLKSVPEYFEFSNSLKEIRTTDFYENKILEIKNLFNSQFLEFSKEKPNWNVKIIDGLALFFCSKVFSTKEKEFMKTIDIFSKFISCENLIFKKFCFSVILNLLETKEKSELVYCEKNSDTEKVSFDNFLSTRFQIPLENGENFNSEQGLFCTTPKFKISKISGSKSEIESADPSDEIFKMLKMSLLLLKESGRLSSPMMPFFKQPDTLINIFFNAKSAKHIDFRLKRVESLLFLRLLESMCNEFPNFKENALLELRKCLENSSDVENLLFSFFILVTLMKGGEVELYEEISLIMDQMHMLGKDVFELFCDCISYCVARSEFQTIKENLTFISEALLSQKKIGRFIYLQTEICKFGGLKSSEYIQNYGIPAILENYQFESIQDNEILSEFVLQCLKVVFLFPVFENDFKSKVEVNLQDLLQSNKIFTEKNLVFIDNVGILPFLKSLIEKYDFNAATNQKVFLNFENELFSKISKSGLIVNDKLFAEISQALKKVFEINGKEIELKEISQVIETTFSAVSKFTLTGSSCKKLETQILNEIENSSTHSQERLLKFYSKFFNDNYAILSYSFERFPFQNIITQKTSQSLISQEILTKYFISSTSNEIANLTKSLSKLKNKQLAVQSTMIFLLSFPYEFSQEHGDLLRFAVKNKNMVGNSFENFASSFWKGKANIIELFEDFISSDDIEEIKSSCVKYNYYA